MSVQIQQKNKQKGLRKNTKMINFSHSYKNQKVNQLITSPLVFPSILPYPKQQRKPKLKHKFITSVSDMSFSNIQDSLKEQEKQKSEENNGSLNKFEENNELLCYLIKSMQQFQTEQNTSIKQHVKYFEKSQRYQDFNTFNENHINRYNSREISKSRHLKSKKSIYPQQDLFTIRQEVIDNDSDTLSVASKDLQQFNDIKNPIYQNDNHLSPYKQRKFSNQTLKLSSHSRSDEIQGLSSIGSKQLNRYSSEENLQIQQFQQQYLHSPQQKYITIKNQFYIDQNTEPNISNRYIKGSDDISIENCEKKVLSNEQTCITDASSRHDIRKSLESVIMDQELIGDLMPKFIKNEFKTLEVRVIQNYLSRKSFQQSNTWSKQRFCSKQMPPKQIQKIRQIIKKQIQKGCLIELTKKTTLKNFQNIEKLNKKIHKLQYKKISLQKSQQNPFLKPQFKRNRRGLSLTKFTPIRH